MSTMTDDIFRVTIETGNAAYQDGNGFSELADQLERIATSLRDGMTSGYVRDTNGNSTGDWEWVMPA